MLFRIRILGGLRDHILAILDLFWDPFWRPFWSLLGTVFGSIFGGFPGLSRGQSTLGVEADLGGIWGPETGLHQQDKQIYRWKSADL